MINLTRKILTIAICAVLLVSCKQDGLSKKANEYVLFDFEQSEKLDISDIIDATYKIIDTLGNKRLLVNTGHEASKPTIKLNQPKGVTWDLNGYYQIKADVTNVGDKYMQTEMFVGNDPDGLIRWYCSDYVDLYPGETKTITSSSLVKQSHSCSQQTL